VHIIYSLCFATTCFGLFVRQSSGSLTNVQKGNLFFRKRSPLYRKWI